MIAKGQSQQENSAQKHTAPSTKSTESEESLETITAPSDFRTTLSEDSNCKKPKQDNIFRRDGRFDLLNPDGVYELPKHHHTWPNNRDLVDQLSPEDLRTAAEVLFVVGEPDSLRSQTDVVLRAKQNGWTPSEILEKVDSSSVRNELFSPDDVLSLPKESSLDQLYQGKRSSIEGLSDDDIRTAGEVLITVGDYKNVRSQTDAVSRAFQHGWSPANDIPDIMVTEKNLKDAKEYLVENKIPIKKIRFRSDLLQLALRNGWNMPVEEK